MISAGIRRLLLSSNEPKKSAITIQLLVISDVTPM